MHMFIQDFVSTELICKPAVQCLYFCEIQVNIFLYLIYHLLTKDSLLQDMPLLHADSLFPQLLTKLGKTHERVILQKSCAACMIGLKSSKRNITFCLPTRLNDNFMYAENCSK